MTACLRKGLKGLISNFGFDCSWDLFGGGGINSSAAFMGQPVLNRRFALYGSTSCAMAACRKLRYFIPFTRTVCILTP